MIHCFQCGADLPDNLNYCLHCGSELTAEPEQPTVVRSGRPSERSAVGDGKPVSRVMLEMIVGIGGAAAIVAVLLFAWTNRPQPASLPDRVPPTPAISAERTVSPVPSPASTIAVIEKPAAPPAKRERPTPQPSPPTYPRSDFVQPGNFMNPRLKSIGVQCRDGKAETYAPSEMRKGGACRDHGGVLFTVD